MKSLCAAARSSLRWVPGCLIAAYLLSATSGSSATLTSFMLALLLVILGTYGVFTGVSAEVLRRLRKGARFYEDASEFVVVSGLQHRMRKNAAGLTNICLFSCAALFTLCCSFSVLFGQDAVIARVGQALAEGQIGLNTAAVDAQEISLMFTTLAFLGVFFVLVFLACTALVLYYRQLAEGTEDAGRFRILRAVGLSNEMTRRTARQQLRVVFLLPLGGTLLHIAFAFPFFATFMGLISINAPSVLIGQRGRSHAGVLHVLPVLLQGIDPRLPAHDRIKKSRSERNGIFLIDSKQLT